MDRVKIEGVVNAMYEARLANDAASCRACFSNDAHLALVGENAQVYQTENVVPPSLDEQINALVGAWEWQSIDNQRFVIDGNKVATMYQLTTTFRPTGEQITTTIFDHMLIGSDGKISEFIEFVDTALIQRLASSGG